MNRFTLAERIVIECGIYQKLKLSEIAKKIGKTPGSVSREIRTNRTVAPGEHRFGKDCHFAGECKTKGLCGENITVLTNNINSIRRDSLGNKSPYEATTDKSIFRLMELMGLHRIPADEINLTPTLLKR